MAPTNDFVPFAPTDTGGNLVGQADYLVDAQRTVGNQPGIARLQLVNKALRQATAVAAAVAQFLSNATGDSVLDDGNQANLLKTMNKVWPCPTGVVLEFGGTSAPAGFLMAQGQAVSRTTYAALYNTIGTAFGVGDGSTTFNLPDRRGVFARGAGSQTVAGKVFTGVLGTVAKDSTAVNGLHDSGHTHSTPLYGPGSNDAYGAANGTAPINTGKGVGVASAALAGDAETAPAAIGMNYIIKT